MALAGYLGGKYNVCGVKWYGSNIANKEKELPRSILVQILNDADTGAPLAFMSANILSSVRTGAVPGVAAKHLAKKNAEVLGVVGCGVIGNSSMRAILTAKKGIKTVKIYDLYTSLSENVARNVEQEFQVKALVVHSLKEAVEGSDIINFATAGDASPEVDPAWIKPGALITLPGNVILPKEFFIKQTIMVDNWKMYEAYKTELESLPGTFSEKNSGICGSLMDYVFNGDLPREQVNSIGDVIVGKHPGRKSDDEIIIEIADGMPVQDIAWAWEVYQNALKLNIGTKLNLF